MLSAAGFPARTYRRRARGSASRELARVCGLSSPGLLGWFDRDTWLLKTCQGCLIGERYQEYAENWPDSGMWDLGAVYELQTSEPRISESEFSLWPTATGEDSKHATNSPSQNDRHPGNLVIDALKWPTANTKDAASAARHTTTTGVMHQGTTLTDAIRNWPTPSAQEGGGSQSNNRSRGGNRKDEMGLDQQGRNWITPSARDWKSETGAENCRYGGLDKSKTPPLARQVYLHSLPAPQTPDGPPSSESGPTSRRRLNPRFVEWLLGLPIGHTEVD